MFVGQAHTPEVRYDSSLCSDAHTTSRVVMRFIQALLVSLTLAATVSLAQYPFAPSKPTVRIRAADTGSVSHNISQPSYAGFTASVSVMGGSRGVYLTYSDTGAACKATRDTSSSVGRNIPLLNGTHQLNFSSARCVAVISMDTTKTDTVWVTLGATTAPAAP